MREEIPKCKDCGQLMIEVGGIGKSEQLGEFDKPMSIDGITVNIWRHTGVREQKLYQCPVDKTIVIY